MMENSYTSELADKALGSLRRWRGFEAVRRAMNAEPGLEVYLAGGALRNLVLGIDAGPRDFDLFLGGGGVQGALDMLGQSGLMGKGPFGSPRWRPAGVKGDNGAYCDVIPIERFKNGLWPCRDIKDVLNQFDFTGNAIALDLRTRMVFDPQNGIRDMQGRIMRAVRFDYPEEPIAQGRGITRPAVVWLRLLHYAARLGLAIEGVTLRWLEENRRYAVFAPEFEEAIFPLHTGALSLLGD